MSKIDSEFWKTKKVLVTGHTGFKGAWLIEWLHGLGANIHGFALLPENTPNLYGILKTPINSERIGNLCDFNLLEDYVLDVNPDIIFHLASQAIVRRGYQDPLGTIQTNVLGTANL